MPLHAPFKKMTCFFCWQWDLWKCRANVHYLWTTEASKFLNTYRWFNTKWEIIISSQFLNFYLFIPKSAKNYGFISDKITKCKENLWHKNHCLLLIYSFRQHLPNTQYMQGPHLISGNTMIIIYLKGLQGLVRCLSLSYSMQSTQRYWVSSTKLLFF